MSTHNTCTMYMFSQKNKKNYQYFLVDKSTLSGASLNSDCIKKFYHREKKKKKKKCDKNDKIALSYFLLMSIKFIFTDSYYSVHIYTGKFSWSIKLWGIHFTHYENMPI